MAMMKAVMIKLVLIMYVLAMPVSAHEGAHDDDFKNAMESMKTEYKKLEKAGTAADMKPYAKAFNSSLLKATAIKPPADAPPEVVAQVNEGLDKLLDKVKALIKAIELGQDHKAKVLIKEMGELRKEYHKKLDVKSKK